MSGSARPKLLVAHAVHGASGRGQDRIAVVRVGDAVVLAVADGSGGTRGGAEAADRAVQLVADYARRNVNGAEHEWANLIARIDAAPGERPGQCALVVAAVLGHTIVGASAGDCGAWLIGDEIEELTEEQVRKPLVGSGAAVPVAFRKSFGAGTLLLASDGLLKYARRKDIANTAQGADLDAAAVALAELPRLRSGDLQDDLAVVLCRERGA